jgi:hypothetical protein
MKTAIQELIEKFQQYNKPKIKGLVRINMSLDNVIEFCEEALEKEKEQIIDAYEDGKENERDSITNIYNYRIGEFYYNQTYNQQ